MVESVDTRDLKSLGHCGCAGSSPASSTRKIAIIWMINGCDFCFIYLHHICTTELMGHLGPLVIPGDSSIIFLLAEKGLYFNGRIYEYGNKVKLLQRYFFKCFENLFHN